MKRFRSFAAFAIAAVSFAQLQSRTPAVKSDWSLSVAPLTSPAAAGSAQPQLSARNDRVLLSWVERVGSSAALKFAERTADGWTEPRTVAAGGDWFVNWADVPSVVRLEDGLLAAHWLQKSAASTYAYDVRLSFSRNDGRTWTSSITPHHDRTHTEHGFASLFQMPGAGLGLTWLDGRQMKEDPRANTEAGPMSIRSAVFDRSGSQIGESLIDDRVCECCPTAVAVTSEGPIVAFRNRTENEIRDIYISRSVNGKWTESIPVHQDGWKIAACPVNGPALSANGRDVAIAWFTAVGEQGHVYASFSRDAGRRFGDPVRIDDTSAVGRVDVELMADGAAVVSWIEYADQRGQFRLRRVEPSGTRSPSISVAGISTGRASGYPRMSRGGSELILAWTDTGEASHVRAAVAKLSRSSAQH